MMIKSYIRNVKQNCVFAYFQCVSPTTLSHGWSLPLFLWEHFHVPRPHVPHQFLRVFLSLIPIPRALFLDYSYVFAALREISCVVIKVDLSDKLRVRPIFLFQIARSLNPSSHVLSDDKTQVSL